MRHSMHGSQQHNATMPPPPAPQTHSAFNTKRPPSGHHRILAITITFVVLLVLGCSFFAYRLYQEAQQVRQHEQKAVSLLAQMQSISSKEELRKNIEKLPQFQEETAAARTITEGTLWKVASKFPYYGSDVTTIQGMTKILDELSQKAIPNYLSTLSSLTSSSLSEKDGSLNLKVLITFKKPLAQANTTLQQAYKDYRALDTPHIGSLKAAYDSGESKLKHVSDTSQSLIDISTILPSFLGINGKKTYVISSVTPAETRSGGGLVGSLGSMTAVSGRLSIGNFSPNAHFMPLGPANTNAETARVFKKPLPLSFDIRDQNAIPDFARAAQGISEIWKRANTSADDPSGVIQIDPVFLQLAITISGDIKLANGAMLTKDNTAEYLQNTIYKSVPVPSQDAVFSEVATRTVEHLFDGMNFSKLLRFGQIIRSMESSRHLQIYVTDHAMQKYFSQAGFSPAPQSNEKSPTLGIYVNQGNASKMDWYTKRTTTVTQKTSLPDGSSKYHVIFTLNNTLNSNEVGTLPHYITGFARIPQGYSLENILFYAPEGGSISEVKLSGKAVKLSEATLNGKSLFTSVITLEPSQSATYEFDVITSPQAKADLSVDQTPTTTLDSGITYDTGIPEIK